MRVALLTPWYWPEVRRGAERTIDELATGLVAAGHRPRVITSDPSPSRRATHDRYAVIRHPRPLESLVARRGFEAGLTHLPFSYASLLRGDDDLAHAHYPTEVAVAARWAARRRRPVVLSYHGVPHRAIAASRRLRLRLTRDALVASDAVVVSSRAAAAAMSRVWGCEARCIYPGVNLDALSPGGTRSADPTIVCAAAPDDARKRVPMLVRAFRTVRRRRPGARLVLMRPRDEGWSRRLGDLDGVSFFEPRERPEDLAPLFRSAWVSALSAYNEAFGLVLAEALACGTPGVGTRDGGIPEIIDRDEVGRLFAPDDEDDLARALLEALELAEDPATARACRASAERFSSTRFVRAHEELYRELLTQ